MATNAAAGNWKDALTVYAKYRGNPIEKFGEDEVLQFSEDTITIYDGYEKSIFHFLVMPRIPFPLTSATAEATSSDPPDLKASRGKLTFGTSSKRSHAPASHVASISSMLASPYASQILAALRDAYERARPVIQEMMRNYEYRGSKPCGVAWGIRAGFHAVPSMDTVHLHVMSEDLVGKRLQKIKKSHFNSFHPDPAIGFWLPLEYVEKLVADGATKLPHSDAWYERQRDSTPMYGYRDKSVALKNMPAARIHLQKEFDSMMKGLLERGNGSGEGGSASNGAPT